VETSATVAKPGSSKLRRWVNRLVIAGAAITFAIILFGTLRNLYYFSHTFHKKEDVTTLKSGGFIRMYTDSPLYMGFNDSDVINAYLTQGNSSDLSRGRAGFIVKAQTCDITAPGFDVQPVNHADTGQCQWIVLSKYVGSQTLAVRITHGKSVVRSYLGITVGDNPFSLSRLAGLAGLVTAVVALYFRFVGRDQTHHDA
jgi:hypothetical protein